MNEQMSINRPSSYLTQSGQVAMTLVEKLPPEAIIKIVDIIGDIAHANKILEGNDQAFQQNLTMLREKNLDRKDRLDLLSAILSSPQLSEKDISQIVTSICNIAEGKSG
ncbi:MAG: hypothetical protein L6R45_18775 [Anaerolineae bacterium]|nr:hypothetical protein [Anaerolineae bacterium]